MLKEIIDSNGLRHYSDKINNIMVIDLYNFIFDQLANFKSYFSTHQ